MNCFLHERTAAVGLCAVCQKAVCRDCVGRDAPRVVCCDPAAVDFVRQWLGERMLPLQCRLFP